MYFPALRRNSGRVLLVLDALLIANAICLRRRSGALGQATSGPGMRRSRDQSVRRPRSSVRALSALFWQPVRPCAFAITSVAFGPDAALRRVSISASNLRVGSQPLERGGVESLASELLCALGLQIFREFHPAGPSGFRRGTNQCDDRCRYGGSDGQQAT